MNKYPEVRPKEANDYLCYCSYKDEDDNEISGFEILPYEDDIRSFAELYGQELIDSLPEDKNEGFIDVFDDGYELIPDENVKYWEELPKIPL